MRGTGRFATLFDGQTHPLEAPLSELAADSRRFAAFLDANATKVRKKLRTTREAEALSDLHLELETAYLLLRERSFSVEFEPVRGGGRGPDFAVSFTTSLTFFVEVTRLRAEPFGCGSVGHATERARTAAVSPGAPQVRARARFDDALCRKLGQLQAGAVNVVIIAVLGPPPVPAVLGDNMARLLRLAEGNDPRVVAAHGCRDRPEFLRRHARLSALLVRGNRVDGGVTVWENPRAGRPLPSRVRGALVRSHTSQGAS